MVMEWIKMGYIETLRRYIMISIDEDYQILKGENVIGYMSTLKEEIIITEKVSLSEYELQTLTFKLLELKIYHYFNS